MFSFSTDEVDGLRPFAKAACQSAVVCVSHPGLCTFTPTSLLCTTVIASRWSNIKTLYIPHHHELNLKNTLKTSTFIGDNSSSCKAQDEEYRKQRLQHWKEVRNNSELRFKETLLNKVQYQRLYNRQYFVPGTCAGDVTSARKSPPNHVLFMPNFVGSSRLEISSDLVTS